MAFSGEVYKAHSLQNKPEAVYGVLYGWRAFKVEGTPQEFSIDGPIKAQRGWGNKVREAECLNEQYNKKLASKMGTHGSAPDPGCSCGFYAYASLEHLRNNLDSYSANSVAVVSAWGKVILHEYGFRSQYMKIERLFLSVEELRDAVEEKYEIPCYDLKYMYDPELNPFVWARHIDLTERTIPLSETDDNVLKMAEEVKMTKRQDPSKEV
jgi:hypothetical protein